MFRTISTIKDEKSAAKFPYIKTVSSKVVAQSIAFRVVSISWQGLAPFHWHLNAKGPTPNWKHVAARCPVNRCWPSCFLTTGYSTSLNRFLRNFATRCSMFWNWYVLWGVCKCPSHKKIEVGKPQFSSVCRSKVDTLESHKHNSLMRGKLGTIKQ